jgi:small subunit ribosomal protein S30e
LYFGVGKKHGSLARAGKVRGQTPKAEKKVRAKKIVKGRAYKRLVYKRRYASVPLDAMNKKRKGPNWHAGREDLIKAEAEKQAQR